MIVRSIGCCHSKLLVMKGDKASCWGAVLQSGHQLNVLDLAL
jgi:hypothetical protein